MKRDLRAVTDAYVKLCVFHRTPPHVRELAQHLSIAPSVLSKRFRARYGELPSTYMKRRQLGVAIQLLQTTTLGIAAIAQRSGFGTRATFFRTFRRLLHRAPSSFRVEIDVTSHRHQERSRLRRPSN